MNDLLNKYCVLGKKKPRFRGFKKLCCSINLDCCFDTCLYLTIIHICLSNVFWRNHHLHEV